jgi:acyl-CoA dehydrogenase
MNDSHDRLLEEVANLFGDRDGEMQPAETWEVLERANLTLLSVPGGSGGSGGTLRDAAAVLHLTGRHAASVPLAETSLLAGWALSWSGLSVPKGPLSAAPARHVERVRFRREGRGWALSGRLRHVPWARTATHLVVVGSCSEGGLVALVDPQACEISPGENLAGEFRDDVIFDNVLVEEAAPAGVGIDEEALLLRGALARSVSMTGALERVLELSVRYAGEREQFGRPIGRFQAIQQQLAILAGEVAAAKAAASAAVEAAGRADKTADAAFEISAAKVRVGEAAGMAVGIAHQVHGAIGFTERHPLRHFTLRLWSWRDDFGTENEWASRLGGIVAKRGAEALWPTITSPPLADEQ